MILVAGVLLWLAVHGVVASSVIPLLGVFYIAFSRMLPLGHQMYANWVTISYFWPTIDIVHSGLSESRGGFDGVAKYGAPCVIERDVSFDKSLQFDDVHYRYPTAVHAAISGFSCSVRFGQQVALVGRSGAGKSTILDLLLGLVQPSSGAILIDGQRLAPELLSAWRRHIAYVPQHLFLFDSSLAENIAFGIAQNNIDHSKVEEAVARASLGPLLKRLPEGLKTKLGDKGVRLSGGERQRVGIARALYRQPRLLVLDEATSALDTETERAILSELGLLKNHVTCIIVTHRLESLGGCDQIIEIADGRNAAMNAPCLVQR